MSAKVEADALCRLLHRRGPSLLVNPGFDDLRELGAAIWFDLRTDGVDVGDHNAIFRSIFLLGDRSEPPRPLFPLDDEAFVRSTVLHAAYWAHYGFPMIDAAFEKHAAALAFTDVPSGLWPWPAFALRIPPNVVPCSLPISHGAPRDMTWIRHVLCARYAGVRIADRVGTMLNFLLLAANGASAGITVPEDMAGEITSGDMPEFYEDGSDCRTFAAQGLERTREDDRMFAAAVRIAMNAKEALVNSVTFQGDDEAKRPHGLRRPHGVPECRRFVVGHAIALDVRAALHSYVRGAARELRPLQWIVRGHWRNQAHGTARLLRSRRWIEPHWARRDGAPDDAPIVARAHKVKL